MPRGGARIGAGKPKGHKLTKERKKELLDARKIEKEFHQKILKFADKLFASQATLARGCTWLWKIEKDSKGNNKPPERVTSQREIEEYLTTRDDLLPSDTYFFMTTEKPDQRAIDSFNDRVYGKATQKVETKNEHVINNIQDIERTLKTLATKKKGSDQTGEGDSDTSSEDPL